MLCRADRGSDDEAALALNCFVIEGGEISVGDEVTLARGRAWVEDSFFHWCLLRIQWIACIWRRDQSTAEEPQKRSIACEDGT